MIERTGVTLPLQQFFRPPAYVDIAARAEALGYDSVWLPEVAGPDVFSLKTAIALRTERVLLASGVIPVQIRTPVVYAFSAATVDSAGYEDEVMRALERWNAGDRKAAVAELSDDMVDSINALGTADECATHLKAFRSAGVTHLVVAPWSAGPDPAAEIAATIEAFAPVSST